MPTTPLELPTLDSDYVLSPEVCTAYQRKGHAIVRGLASPEEVAIYRPIIAESLEQNRWETRPLEERDAKGKAFLQVENLWEKGEVGRRFVFARRFAHVAAQLMGVPSVRLYHDNILYKEAGGGPTPWHQDQYHWPIQGGQVLTLWMPLVDVSEEMGSLTFVDGSQELGYFRDFSITEESQRVFGALIEERALKLTTYGAMKAGDATFHAGWTLHSAPGNPTNRVREVMTIIYYADGVAVDSADNPARVVDLRNNFPGLQPGDVAATERNPVLYSSN